MRRRLAIGIAILGVLAAMLYLFRGPLAVRVMRRALDRNMQADAIGALPDGLHVVLCGAGGPLPDPIRSGPCVAVIAGKTLFLVDSGSGAARNLMRMGLPPSRVEALFLTHFHSDHIDGVGEVEMLRWTGGPRHEPLPVFGPSGVEEVVEGFNRAYRLDDGYRTAHHGAAVVPPSGAGGVARPFAAPALGESVVLWDADGVRVVAFRVEHEPVSPAVGYRFEYGGRTAVISGDTRKSENLVIYGEDADVLVHEALSPRLVGVITQAAAGAGRANVEKLTRDILDYHTTPVEAAQIAQRAGARHLLFYHIVPPLPLPGLETAFVDGVSDEYHGGVTVGRDGTMVSLPRDSDEVEVGSLP